MHRGPTLDLAYMHEMPAAPAQPAPAASPREDARDLVARLACLKALMDAEREAEPLRARAAARRTGVH